MDGDDTATEAAKRPKRAEVVVGYERVAYMFEALLQAKILRAGSIPSAEQTRDKAAGAAKREALLDNVDTAHLATLRAEEVAGRSELLPCPST